MKKKLIDITGDKYKISVISYEPEGNILGAVVCLHGFGGDKHSSAVRMLGEHMSERGYAVLCLDFPAHGRSEAQEEMLTVENCINDTITVSTFAENEYGKISFFATSFGAYILAQVLEKPCFKGVSAVFRSPAVKMADTFLFPICNLTSAELKNAGTVECGFERKLQLGYAFYSDLLCHSIDNVKFENETLMIYGDRDDVVRPSDMAEFAAGRANIEEYIIAGADHRFKGNGQLEAAIKAAAEFLERGFKSK